MSAATLTNGKPKVQPEPKVQPLTHWAQLPVNHFLATFNWDNRAPELQAPLPQEPFDLVPLVRLLDLRLTVSQFFGDINWAGTPSATPIQDMMAPEEASPVADNRGTLTLGDFADLF